VGILIQMAARHVTEAAAAILPSIQKEHTMSFGDLCQFLAALSGLGILLLKAVELARLK
jgi:hypothetical protein